MADEGGFWGMVKSASGVDYTSPSYASANQYQSPAGANPNVYQSPAGGGGVSSPAPATVYQSKAPPAAPPMTPAYYSPAGGYPSSVALPSNVQTSAQPIALGGGIPAQPSQVMSYANPASNVAIPFSDLQAYFYPYTGKELRTITDITPQGYTVITTKYGTVPEGTPSGTATPKPPPIPVIQSGVEAAYAKVKEADTKASKDFTDIFSALGLTSEQFAARSQLAQAGGTPVGALVPSKNFGRSSDYQNINDQLDRLAEAGKGALYYLTSPFIIAADIGRATAGRAALFTTQLARGQREEALQTAEKFPAELALTGGVIAGGAVQSVVEAAKGTPAAVGGLFFTPIALHGLGEYAKGSPLKATFQERVSIAEQTPSSQGVSIRGTVENVAKSGGREVATVEQFNQLIFKERTVQPSTIVNFGGEKYIVQEQPMTLKPEVSSAIESKGFQQTINPAMTSAAERLGLDFSRTIKGSFAESVQPVTTTGIGLTESASVRLEGKLRPPITAMAIENIGGFVRENPSPQNIVIGQQIINNIEKLERGTILSHGEGAVGGGGGFGKIGGKEFASVGVSRFVLKEPSASEGFLVQSYVAQSQLVKGGQASATGTGMLIMPSEVATELLGGKSSSAGKIAKINSIIDSKTIDFSETARSALEESKTGKGVYAQSSPEVLKDFQNLISKQIVSSSESARGASLSALVEARNTALERAVNLQRPTLTLSYAAMEKGGFVSIRATEEQIGVAPKLSNAFKLTSGTATGSIETEIERVRTEIKIPVTSKGRVETETGTATGLSTGTSTATALEYFTTRTPKTIEDINDAFHVSTPEKIITKEEVTNPSKDKFINKFEEVIKFRTENIFIPGLIDIFREGGPRRPRLLPPGSLGGGGAMGDKIANVKDGLHKNIQRHKNLRLVARADPFTALVSQLRTGRSPFIEDTARVRAAFKTEIQRHPLLARFGGRT